MQRLESYKVTTFFVFQLNQNIEKQVGRDERPQRNFHEDPVDVGRPEPPQRQAGEP